MTDGRRATDGGTLIDLLWRHAAHDPDGRFALVVRPDGETEISWSGLRDQSAAFAAAYAAAGVAPGDVVLIFLDHGAALFPSFYGAMAMGAVPSFMPLPSPKQDPALYWSSHAVLVDRIRPAAVLTTAAHRAAMTASGFAGETAVLSVEDVDPTGGAGFVPVSALDSLALLQHSSGTTGLKKGVALSHRAIIAQLDSYAEALGLSDSDGIASWLPVYHDMGLIACTLLPVHSKLPLISMDPFHWLTRPAMLLDAAANHRSTFIWLPNFAFQHLSRVSPPKRMTTRDLSHVRAFINCSEVCRPATFDTFAATFAEVSVRREQLQVCYAAAETVFAISQTPRGDAAKTLTVDRAALVDGRVEPLAPGTAEGQTLLSCGRVISALTVTIQREDGAVLGEDCVGEVTIAGPSLFDGYYRLPELTERKLRDGRYSSGDLGFVHDGELYVLGRKDDVIVVNGRNYMAHDLEAVANRVSGLKPGRSVAMGVFNERLGSNDICVVAERDPEADAAIDDEALASTLREVLLNEADAPTADIRVVEPGWLVKTTSGKISREKNLVKYQEAFG